MGVEVNLRGLLELDKSDLSGNKDRDRANNSEPRFLRNSSGDSGPDLSFDKLASLEFGLARASLVAVSKLYFSFGCSEGDYTSSCLPSLSGFFLIDGGISDAMVWIHPNAAIDDPRPTAGSFNMADVRCLSAHVIKLRDMPESVLVLSGLSRVWKNRFCDPVLRGADGNVMGIHDFLCLHEWTGAEVQEEPHLDVRPTLQRLPFYCTPPAVADAVIPNPTPEDLVAGTSSSNILAKAEASQKRKASTSGVASSHVAKRIRSALAQSSGSTTRPSLFAGDDDESDADDACVEIPLVTPFCSAAVIPSLGNQDSRGKGIMVDDVAAPSGRVSRQRPSSRPAPSFRDVSSDAIHTVLMKEVFKDPVVCKTIVDHFPTPGDMVRVEGLSDDQLTAKMSVLHCMMMSHGGELLARYRGLNQYHHEYVLSIDSRLKGYEEKVVGLTGLELQVSTLKKQVSGLNDKLATSDASFSKSKAKGNERKKKIKSLSKSLDNLHSEVARLSSTLNQANILEAERDEEILRLKATPSEFSSFFRGQFQDLVWKFLTFDEFSRVQGELLSLDASAGFEHGLSMHRTKDEFFDVLKKMIFEYAVEPLSVILQLEPEKLVRPANVPIPRGTRVSPHIAKESTVTPVSKFLELSANVVPASSAVALEQNEEHVSATVDGSDLEMTDGVAHSKSEGVFVQGTSYVLDDVTEVTVLGSERVFSGLTDDVVALSAGEKGDGSAPSSTVEEVVVPPSGV
ncbi:hypothetical protein Tco_0071207 [Tanacetum coccineum]